MNKNQKAVVFFWVIITGCLGGYAAYVSSGTPTDYRHWWPREIIPPIVVWVTVTIMTAAVVWLFSEKKH